jgi:hypothetical protein
MSSSEFRGLLEAGDVAGLRAAWHALFPQMPQPETHEQAEIVLHVARTQAESVSLRLRAWSHRWLLERGLPSGLPDALKPRAERIYPRIVEAVGISVNTRRPGMIEVRTAMEHAVLDLYADSPSPDPLLVARQMKEAREKTLHALFG